MIKLSYYDKSDILSEAKIDKYSEKVSDFHNKLHSKTGKGSQFLGWLDLPKNYDRDEVESIKQVALKIRRDSDVLIVIGIGGSYLGARAAIEFIKSPFYNNLKGNRPQIFFAGNNLSQQHFKELVEIVKDRDFSINVISKSGTTTEPAIAFRFFKKLLYDKYGEGARDRIYVTTDKSRGALKEFADNEGFTSFVIPDDVGGRYSVLTAVGLLPMAVAGIDIDRVLKGADDACRAFDNPDLSQNACYRYAVMRNILLDAGKTIEIMACYEPRFKYMAEWYKQLFGESEGKDNKGIFPASVDLTADLHSMGQYIQEGKRNLFETVIELSCDPDIFIDEEDGDSDGLNYLAGKSLVEINKVAQNATVIAHADGGVPNIVISFPKPDEECFGYMVYFFEKACAMSGYILKVNPFDQPGVEYYKKNMFALLGKKGYEEILAKLRGRM